jgi:IS5 family transposase
VIRQIHEKVVQAGQQAQVVAGRKMRVDTTGVETNIHYPTDSTLLGEGVRVLTRTMKQIEQRRGTQACSNYPEWGPPSKNEFCTEK